jgi:antitoxin component of MazEF toxin-antitoxin module
MSTLTVTAKGQITFRKDLLQHLGVHPGEQLTVQKLPDGRIQVMATKASGQISDAFDMLKSKTNTKLSIDEMSAVAAHGWAGKS